MGPGRTYHPAEHAAEPHRAPVCGSHSGPRWYVVLAHRHHELEARDNLARQGFEAYLPLSARPVRGGVLIGPWFPPYLFVRFDVHRHAWRRAAHTRGVARLCGPSPEAPAPIPDGEVERIRAGEPERLVIRHLAPAPPAAGGAIEVTDGLLRGARGICCRADRVEVVATLMLPRGPTEVTLPAKWCVAA